MSLKFNHGKYIMYEFKVLGSKMSRVIVFLNYFNEFLKIIIGIKVVYYPFSVRKRFHNLLEAIFNMKYMQIYT